MASRWYRKVDDAEVGPVTFQDLVEMIVAGVLTGEDWVRREFSPEWMRARTIIGLFHAAEKMRSTLHTDDAPSTPTHTAPAPAISNAPADSPKPKWLEPVDYWILGVAALVVLIVNLSFWRPASPGKLPEPRLWHRPRARAGPDNPNGE